VSPAIEGTIVLDGMVEGRLPEADPTGSRLGEWVDLARGVGLRFSLETDGGQFSLLAGDDPLACDALGPDPAETIRGTLEAFVKAFDPKERAKLFSTVRSMEYRPGVEVQTAYTVASGGTVELQQRTVEAETMPAAAPLSRRQKLKLAAAGTAGALVLLAVSALFVDYRAVLSNLASAATPFDPKKLEIDASRFSRYFSVEKATLGRPRTELVLELRRTESFPRSEGDIERAAGAAGDSVGARLALDAVVRGYVRVEYLDAEGEFIASAIVRIKSLRGSEKTEVSLPLPRAGRPATLAIVY
jgi:hypothetical protein